jgi:hypothetical protein
VTNDKKQTVKGTTECRYFWETREVAKNEKNVCCISKRSLEVNVLWRFGFGVIIIYVQDIKPE